MKQLLILGMLFGAFGTTTFAAPGDGVGDFKDHIELLEEAKQKSESSDKKAN